ncbi:MAG: hypothetical protein ACR2P2_18770 [Nakamurella sp.]
MNRLARLTTMLGIGAAIVAIGLGSASAAIPTPAPPPLPHGLTAIPNLAPTLQGAHEDVFVPITPCRAVDTRVHSAPFGNGTSRGIYVAGTVGFAPQGGKSGGCGIPIGATAVTATISAVSPTHGGFIRAWPNGLAEPNATLVSYAASSISVGATVGLSASAQQLRVKNYGGPTQLVIDVTGYYAKQIDVLISPSGTGYSGTSRITGVTRVGTGAYAVTVDRDPRYCSATATVYSSNYTAGANTYYTTNTILVTVYDTAAVAADAYVYLAVTC